jgi:hypothetical protein
MNTLIKQNIIILILALIGLSKVTMGADPKVSIRLYCFYIPKAMLSATPKEQISSAKYEKLMGPTGSRKFLATSKPTTYELTEEEYLTGFEECQTFVKDKGQVLDLKGTDASWPETLSRFSRVIMQGKDETVLLSLDDPEVIKNLGIEGVFKQNIESVIQENPGLLRNLAKSIANNPLAQAAKSAATSEYTGMALAVAGTLAAAWFAPAYVAAAVELLYPVVYGALFGVPSKFGLSYWMVYYPGKMHAVAWAYNNAALITTLTGAALGVGYKWLTGGSSKEEIKAGIQKAADDLKSKEVPAT